MVKKKNRNKAKNKPKHVGATWADFAILLITKGGIYYGPFALVCIIMSYKLSPHVTITGIKLFLNHVGPYCLIYAALVTFLCIKYCKMVRSWAEEELKRVSGERDEWKSKFVKGMESSDS